MMRLFNSLSPTVMAIVGTVVLVLVIAVGLLGDGSWDKAGVALRLWDPSPQLQGEVLGRMPKPTQPGLNAPVLELVAPPPTRLQKMLVKRIPTIVPGSAMPHPNWGPCTNCHLIQGGLPAGSQPATPVAKVWEQISVYHKVGPPILPNSPRPHPPSGRCIKCHDVLVYVQTQ
ncbi:MAG: magnetochrome domain-containing protein [Magnetococcales bacterium]|nr:magnetochrome domain-containing protein [Magnetococcales bacterium]MBF0116019.1 magnetochrome domain-containing protein [Magnetococcales bacterium]